MHRARHLHQSSKHYKPKADTWVYSWHDALQNKSNQRPKKGNNMETPSFSTWSFLWYFRSATNIWIFTCSCQSWYSVSWLWLPVLVAMGCACCHTMLPYIVSILAWLTGIKSGICSEIGPGVCSKMCSDNVTCHLLWNVFWHMLWHGVLLLTCVPTYHLLASNLTCFLA